MVVLVSIVSELTAGERIRINDEATIIRTAIVTQILASGIVKYVHVYIYILQHSLREVQEF